MLKGSIVYKPMNNYTITNTLLINEGIFEKTSDNIISIDIPSDEFLSKKLFLINNKKKFLDVPGLNREMIPNTYIEEHFRHSLEKTLINIFYITHAHPQIIEKLMEEGLLIPDKILPYTRIDLQENTLTFQYIHSKCQATYKSSREVKKIRFSPRKKYRDLDKQAEQMIANEYSYYQTYQDGIENKDWVKIAISWENDPEQVPAIAWFQANDEPINSFVMNEIKGKKIGESFYTKNLLFREYLDGGTQCINERILITILDTVPNAYFSFERLKLYCECTSEKELHETLVSLFSFKHDISLRRENATHIVQNLLNYYKVHVDDDTVKLHLKTIEDDVKKNPDYLIYQSQQNFFYYINALACKQIQEYTLFDYLATKEQITVEDNDIRLYFNLLQRGRLKDFIQFDNSLFSYRNRIHLIPQEMVHTKVRREKTLNYFVKILQKKSF